MTIWVNKLGGGYAEGDTRPTPEWISIDELPEQDRAQALADAEAALYPEVP